MLRPVHDVEDLLRDEAFWIALVVAAVGVALVWLRLRRGSVNPGLPLAVVVAVLVAFRFDHAWPAALAVGLVLLVVGEWATGVGPRWLQLVVSVPGALILGASLPDGWPFWARVVLGVGTVVGGLVVLDADRAMPRLVPALLALGALGVWLCVPDTEAPKALLGALLAAAVLGFEPRLRHAVGSFALLGLFLWVVTFGGVARPGSIVGGVACLGVLLLFPVLPTAETRVGVATVLVVQAGVVVYLSRVAGFEQAAGDALLLAIPAFVVAGVVAAIGLRQRGRAASSR
jgi:hypothetical protein